MSSVVWNDDLIERARLLVARLDDHSLKLATAESCTGGLLSALITEIPGSSNALDRAFVTYSDAAKAEMLGVPKALIETHGAVSAPVARAMALGAFENSSALITVSITGVAGPGGGTEQKPVGLVHFASCHSATRDTPPHCIDRERRFGDIGRAQVRSDALNTALDMIDDAVTDLVNSAGDNTG